TAEIDPADVSVELINIWNESLTNSRLENFVGGCTADGATGEECYNTLATCASNQDYDGSSTLTLRFSMAGTAPIMGENVYPAVKSINIAPTKLAPGKGLSSRSKVEVKLIDFTDADRLTDPYFADRDYIATDQGTFFGKLLARNKHHQTRDMRVKVGYFPSDGSAADLTDFDRTYNYIIDRIEGVDAKGNVTIVGKDILSLADGLKVKVPEASTGTLNGAITDVATSLTLQSGEGSDYDASGYVRIGDEIIQYTGITTDTLTGLTRGSAGTTAAAHSDDDSVQQCVEYGFSSTQRVDVVVDDLLQTYAGISASYIPLATDWDSEADTWLASYNLKNIISEPTELNKLLDQICVECGIDLWWSDVDQEVKLKAQVPATSSVDTLDDNLILRDKASIKSDIKDRLSQVYFYTGRRDYTGNDDDVGNYSSVAVRVDADSEGSEEYNSKGIKKVFCQWVNTAALAGQQASRLLNRYVEPPQQLKATIDISQTDFETGDLFLLDSDICQGADGSNKTLEFQMLSTKLDADKQTIAVEGLRFLSSVGNSAFVSATSATGDYTTATGDANPTWSWIAATGGQMPNGDDPYLII
ncbi:MAG: hypothetical protein HKO06_06700, partial [Pseudomonadales bacterium]|nr:hypothetical protein [Pseudomonadales bacterium]